MSILTLGTISVSCGANQMPVTSLEPGATAGDVKERLGDILNIPHDAKIYVNGVEQGQDYMIQPNDSIEFIRPSGEKAVL